MAEGEEATKTFGPMRQRVRFGHDVRNRGGEVCHAQVARHVPRLIFFFVRKVCHELVLGNKVDGRKRTKRRKLFLLLHCVGVLVWCTNGMNTLQAQTRTHTLPFTSQKGRVVVCVCDKQQRKG